MDQLKKLRKDIDRIDQVLITALAERMAVLPQITAYKKDHNIAIFQEKRDLEIMKRMKRIAKDYELDGGFVEEIFESVFNEAKRIQMDIMNKE